MYKILLSIGGLLVLVGGLVFFHRPEAPVAEPETKVAGMQYEIVATEAAREQGLSGRQEVSSDYGMLFVFDTPGQYGFWMKDMYVPIDMIWLKEDGTILGIDANVATSTFPSAFYPPEPVRLVLETKAGEAVRKGWEIGTKIELPAI